VNNLTFRIALQLYSLRDDLSKRFNDVLKEIASIGFEGVEFAGFYGKDPNELKEILHSLGLDIAGAHISIQAFSELEIDRTISFNVALGNRYLIIPGLPKDMVRTRDDWIKFTEILNNLAKKLRQYNMRIGYHNHVVEFTLIEGERPWDLVFSRTSEDIIMQLDIGHALRAGLTNDDIIDVIKRYRGRAISVHAKDYSKEKGYEVVIGEGDAMWLNILKALKDYGGTEWIIIEQETYPYKPPIESIKKSFKNLRNILSTL
jgi:sugar phosphate isomerase/epimerase